MTGTKDGLSARDWRGDITYFVASNSNVAQSTENCSMQRPHRNYPHGGLEGLLRPVRGPSSGKMCAVVGPSKSARIAMQLLLKIIRIFSVVPCSPSRRIISSNNMLAQNHGWAL
ncbi:hypothetical protein PV05_06398 [Exophiala xenobiotica]|uniref:Uncharacterized protein n=1 Tax=Exophiala xenobiotica TaxID=348802 RepID=A0A0D2EHF7_9EURO|nr:uncharacterized protein PV05_06398 [Exophiala xenobiotica]KIW54000.1 hypothetical protein PV05_06398 [Exophiala xenobiotica]